MRTFFLIFAGLLMWSSGALAFDEQADEMNCNIASGKRAFTSCSACHSLNTDKHMQGPSLLGLLGRRAGTVEGFTFSAALEEAEFQWDADALDAFIENPAKFIPGTSMPFGGIRSETRRVDLLCYLSTPNIGP